MARAFTAREAKQLIQQHCALTEKLTKNCSFAEVQRKECNAVANSLDNRGAFAKVAAAELLSGNIREGFPSDFQQLLQLLFRYVQSKPLSNEGSRLFQESQREINQAIAKLKPATNGVQWFFTSRQSIVYERKKGISIEKVAVK